MKSKRAASRTKTTKTKTTTKTMTAEQWLVPSCLPSSYLLFPQAIYSLCCSTDPPAIAHLIGLRFDMNDDFVRDVVVVVVGSIWNLLLAELSADKAVARSLDSFALLWGTYIVFQIFFWYFFYTALSLFDDGKFDLTSCSVRGNKLTSFPIVICSKTIANRCSPHTTSLG